MTDDITDTWLGRAIRDACADVARELTEERPWVCQHNDPSCRRGGYRCSDSCGPLRPGETDPTRPPRSEQTR